jgi:hypothetical protein
MHPEAAVNLLYNARNTITNDLRMLVRSERYFVKTLGLHFFQNILWKKWGTSKFLLETIKADYTHKTTAPAKVCNSHIKSHIIHYVHTMVYVNNHL